MKKGGDKLTIEEKASAKEILNEIKCLDTKINLALKHIEDLREKMTSINSTLSGGERVQASRSDGDKILEIISKIEESEKEVNDLIDEYVDKKFYGLKLINSLDNETYIKILHLRYFENKSWNDISKKLNYTYRHTTKLHGWALVELDKKIGRG